MLKSIDPILTPDLLWLLASMGHGDDLVVVDANHPATHIARSTSSQRLIQLVSRLLDLARLEAGKVELETIALHPSEVARPVIELLR